MADDSDEDKSEEPTEKRLADALERGDTPVSREIAFLTSMAAYLLIEIYVLPATTPQLAAALAHLLDDPSGWRLTSSGDASALAGAVAEIVARFLGPPALLMMAFGVGGSVLQNAPRLVVGPYRAQFPAAVGIRRLVATVRAAGLDGVRQERAEACRRRPGGRLRARLRSGSP